LELALSRDGASEIRSKGGLDIVTAADVAVEEAMRLVLRAATKFPVVGEEGGDNAETNATYWLVDPICGTRNYASGIPLVAVNLALVNKEKLVLGAVGDGSTREVLVAELGMDAFSKGDGDWRAISTSEESKTIVIDGWPTGGAERERAGRFVAKAINANRWDIRSLSTTLAFAYLAEGRVAGYILFWHWEGISSALHTAAGVALAREAGAKVTDKDGKPWTVSSDSIIAAANPQLHKELCEAL